MRCFLFLFMLSFCAKAQAPDTLLPYLLEIKNDTNRINQIYQRGFELRNVNPQMAFQYAKIVEEQALQLQSKKHIAKAYNLLGVLFYKKGDFKTALSYHQQAYQLRKIGGDILGCAISQTNMGNIYVDLKLFKTAEKCHLEAMQIYNQLKDKKRLANCLINLGALKQHRNQQDAAYEYYTLANQIGEELNDYEVRSICLNNMAIVFFSKKNFAKSIALNYDALKLRNLMDDNVEVTDSYLNLASNYIQLKDFIQAKTFLDTAFLLSQHFDYFEAKQEAHKLYSDYFAATGNYQEAFAWLEKYDRIRDSVLNSENTIVDFDSKAEHEEKLPNHFASNLWLIISIFVALIIIPYSLIRYKR